MNKRMILVTLLFSVTLFSFEGRLAGQGPSGSLDVESIPALLVNDQLTYSAKFVCGAPAGPGGAFVGPVAPGVYFTAINIHNPNAFPVEFSKQAAVTRSQGEPRGEIGDEVVETLEPNQGLEVECRDIKVLLGLDPDSQFSELGFVTIRVRTSGRGNRVVNLSVVGVYSATYVT